MPLNTQEQGTNEAAKRQIYAHVLKVGAQGLAEAVWYSTPAQLVLVYINSGSREESFQALRQSTKQQDFQRVERISPVSPRQYMTVGLFGALFTFP